MWRNDPERWRRRAHREKKKEKKEGRGKNEWMWIAQHSIKPFRKLCRRQNERLNCHIGCTVEQWACAVSKHIVRHTNIYRTCKRNGFPTAMNKAPPNSSSSARAGQKTREIQTGIKRRTNTIQSEVNVQKRREKRASLYFIVNRRFAILVFSSRESA